MIVESDKRVDYLHKKTLYVLPGKSKIFCAGSKYFFEIFDRRVSSIAKYKADKSTLQRPYVYKIGLPVTGAGAAMCKEYKVITDYFDRHPSLDFLNFEYITGNQLPLCTFFKPTDMVRASRLIQEINKELPFLINIFRRPLIHLKETDIIQPVDAVKRINHNTLRHLSVHAENWDSVKDGKIEPARLLTKVYDDDYGIYENIVFRDLIDKISGFLRKRIYQLSEVLETFRESIQLDAINRLNHQKYYLAIGKLYVGFSQMENSSEILAMLESTKALYSQLNKYKHRAVYAKNLRVKPLTGAVKKTNILSMHKDYRHVYALNRMFDASTVDSSEAGSAEEQAQSQRGYELFSQMLILFAVSNFNMYCQTNENVYKDGAINASFVYKSWTLTLYSEYNAVLDFNTIVMSMAYKNKPSVKFLIIPMGYYIPQDRRKQYEHIIERLSVAGNCYDKYVFLEPYDYEDSSPNSYSVKFSTEEQDLFYSVLPVSISEINSFRRIQKLLLETMVRSGGLTGTCAFCGEPTVKESADKRLCRKCRTAVKEVTCVHCNKDFFATYIDTKGRKSAKDAGLGRSLALSEFYRQERQYSFRNIVDMNENNFVCPHCSGENKV